MQESQSLSRQRSIRFSRWYQKNIFYWELGWVIVRWIILIGMLVGFALVGGWLFEQKPTLSLPARPQSLPALGSNSMIVGFSQDSQFLMTASSDATLRYYDLNTGNNPDSILILGQESNLVTAAYSPSGRWLAVSGTNNDIWLFEHAEQGSNAEPITLRGHQAAITQLIFSPDENWLISAGQDNNVRVWNLSTRPIQNISAQPVLLSGHTSPITALAVNPSSHWLASGSQDGQVLLWNLYLNQYAGQSINSTVQLPGHQEAITVLDFSPTGRWLASGSTDNTVIMWDVFSPDPNTTPGSAISLTGYRGDINDLEFSPFGHWLVTASEDKSVRMWDMNVIDIPGQTPINLRGFRSAVTSVSITPDRRWLIATGNDKKVRLWNLAVEDIADEKPLVLRDQHGKVLSSMASGNSQRVATVDDRNTILVYDLSTIHEPLLGIFSWGSLRYILIPLAVFIAIIVAASFYVQDIYNLPSFMDGFHYVRASMFGIGYPQLTIDNGKAILRKGEMNLLKAVGGPGFVLIQPGNAAFFRYLRRPSGARINRYVFLGPFESLGPVVNLDDQDGYIESWQCTTKDGIPIELHDIHFRFRVRHIKGIQRSMETPYPIDPAALMQRGGNITVNDRGPIPWEVSVRMAVTTIMTEYIQRNTIDYLTAPRRSSEDPRREFQRYVLQNARVQRIGAEILWVEVGQFHILDDNVEKTRIDAWAVQQRGIIESKMARSEAEERILKEIGRAEGQAEMIRSIAMALEQASVSGNTRGNIQRIFLARVAQIIDNWDPKQLPGPRDQSPNPNDTGKP